MRPTSRLSTSTPRCAWRGSQAAEYARLVERIRMRKADGGRRSTMRWRLSERRAGPGRPEDPGALHRRRRHAQLADLPRAARSVRRRTSPCTPSAISSTSRESARAEQRMELDRFADVTGGQAFFPSAQGLDETFDKIRAEIAARYSLGYVSSDARTDGAWRTVEIKLHAARSEGRPAPHTLRLLRALQGVTPLTERQPGSKPLQLRTCWYDRLLTLSPRPAPRRLTTDGLQVRPLQAGHRFRAARRSGPGDRRDRRRSRARRQFAGPARRHRVGQDVHHGAGIARVNRPTLVMAHNKTLAAQLYQEFRRFFPENAVEYFVSYYDYYQPEAYVPTTDSYIEKEATINDEIDRMRLSATRSLFERRDVIIVASVSCIYGLGSPEAYYGMMLPLERGQRIDREQILRKLVEIQYERNDHDFAPRRLPRPRRHRRGLPVVRGHARCASSCSATRSTSSTRSIRSPGRRSGGTTSSPSIRRRTSSRRASGPSRRSRPSRRSSMVPRRSSSPRARSSRRIACTSGRCSISR